ncbi:BREX-2 system phosphatase PglZ [Sphaerotilus microaerophilus]|nr:BREX-2 system phosphatase PglZ [Sphaerotilus sp. FB-5]
MALSVNEAQITAQLDAVLGRDPQARVVAMRSASKLAWPSTMSRRNRQFTLRWCESRLALREALDSLDEAAGDGTPDGLVLLTPLTEQEVPADVVARLARHRVFQPQGWEIVRQLFGAQGTDARLGAHDWMPQVLVELAQQGPYVPVASSFLDAETAWREVLGRCLELDNARPDACALLAWTLRPDADVLLARLPERARRDTLSWLVRHAGSSGELTVRCIGAGRSGDAVALALVCAVVFAPQGEGRHELATAAVRLERYAGDQPLGIEAARRWSQDARQLVQTLPLEALRGALDRADALLADLRVADLAHYSDLLPLGLEQRLARYAQALEAHLTQPGESTMAEVEDAAKAVLLHHLAATQALRSERVRMSRRLARWWGRPGTSASASPTDLDSLAAQHNDDGAFVDWARARLLGGDELASLSQAYARLRSAVQARRDLAARSFATALSQSLKSARTPGARSVPVEQALERVVLPLAQSQSVLLLVVDGLSVAIFRELFERCERHGWNELIRQDAERPAFGLAVLPTVTSVSRASLLSGGITTGGQSIEKLAFTRHAGLASLGNAHLKPRLFHKADLIDDGHLATEVRAAIGDAAVKVVGVVYNAVDDHLSGPEQLNQRWDLQDLRLLLPILREALTARRVVLVTADHGHVLEDGSRQVGAAQGGTLGNAEAASDRWRAGSLAEVAEEVALSGHRVHTPDGLNSAVLLWSETARYTGRKNGYHGGAAPAEVVVPMSVFAPFGVEVPGRKPAPPQQPEWWDLPGVVLPVPERPVAAKPAPRRAHKAAPKTASAPSLFTEDEAPVPQTAMATAAPQPAVPDAPDWIGDLLTSTVYAAQRQLAARVQLPEDQMRRILKALDERGGKLGKAALAQRLGIAEMRVAGVLSVARRLLNVDQAAVLVVDEAAGVVELNRELLAVQFAIAVPSAALKPGAKT